MKRLLLGVVLAAAACAQPSVEAPAEAGVCWRMSAAGEQPAFQAIDRGIANLETCAVRLEGARMVEGKPVSGAYQGRFIFVDAEQITSAASLDGQRFRVFEPRHRLEIQAGLQRLIEQRKADSPGE